MRTRTADYDTLGDLFASIADVLRPPERLKPSAAAEKYVRIGRLGSTIPHSNAITPYMVEPMDEVASPTHTAVVFAGPAQSGKALAVSTPIATPDGFTSMGMLQVGDTVFNEQGHPVKVLVVSPVKLATDCYRITFDDKSDIVTDGEHLWSVHDYYAENDKILTTSQIAEGWRYRANRFRFSIENAQSLVLPSCNLPIDPYILGYWLGDGCSAAPVLTVGIEDHPHICKRLEDAGYTHRSVVDKVGDPACRVMRVRMDPTTKRGRSIGLELRDLALLSSSWGRKHIPQAYLRASYRQRLELLRGLMDSDGTIGMSGVCEYTTTLPLLSKDVAELVCSLGYKQSTRQRITSCSYKGKKSFGAKSYGTQFFPYSNVSVFHLHRKTVRLHGRGGKNRPTHTGTRRITKVEHIAPVEVRCIGVDTPSHLFLAGRQMVPTHNTNALLLGTIAYSVMVDSMDMMVVNPTQQNARDFSTLRMDKLHRDSPEIGARLMKRADADSKSLKMYRNGMLLFLAWPTISELSGKPIPRVLLTDYDRMPESIEKEGSPFDLASKRTTTFGSYAMTVAESSPGRPLTRKKFILSSAHEAPPTTGILALYNRGDRRRLVWPCPHCGTYFEGTFEHLSYDASLSPADAALTVEMVCPQCGVGIDPDARSEMLVWSVWIKEGQSVNERGQRCGIGRRSRIASFWLRGVAAAFVTWGQLVQKFLEVSVEFEQTGDQTGLQTFFNTDLAEVFIPKGAESDRLPEVLKGRAEPLPEKMVPGGVRFLVACVDVQKNMFKVQVHGILPGTPYDLVVIDRFDIVKSQRMDADGDRQWVHPSTYTADWDELTEHVIERKYPLADGSGRKMMIRLTVCDSGGFAKEKLHRENTTEMAYSYWRRLKSDGKSGRFYLVKGEPRPDAPRTRIEFPDAQRKDRMSGARGEIPVLFLNSNRLKDSLSARLECVEPGRGMFRLPEWLPDWFYGELCAETRLATGWANKSRARNEAWDLAYYCIGACASQLLRVENINWSNPPAWAADWNDNALVTEANAPDTDPYREKTVPKFDFAAMGKAMAGAGR